MGTSSSYPSPRVPRWKAFNRALDHQMPLERLQATFFLAGETEWREAFATPSLACFAEALLVAHEHLAGRLADAERPVPVIASVVSEARAAMFDEGYSPA